MSGQTDFVQNLKLANISLQRAEDLFMRHCYLYYVKNKPVLSDREFDEMHRFLLELYPTSKELNKVGSSRAEDYPNYIRNGWRPQYHERKAKLPLT